MPKPRPASRRASGRRVAADAQRTAGTTDPVRPDGLDDATPEAPTAVSHAPSATPNAVPNTPRTNRDRTEVTRGALMDAARSLFVAQGYGDTSTPDVARAAGITRGALYHHFADKRDLFRAVLAREMAAVAADIRAAAPDALPPAEALRAGSAAYLKAMTVPGRTRLVLVEGPAVLGVAEIMAMDGSAAAATLAEGLAQAGVAPPGVSVAVLADLLSAAFDRAALTVDAGGDLAAQQAAMAWLIDRVVL